jgi:hypothetical protein
MCHTVPPGLDDLPAQKKGRFVCAKKTNQFASLNGNFDLKTVPGSNRKNSFKRPFASPIFFE